jgi:hypothetical protein
LTLFAADDRALGDRAASADTSEQPDLRHAPCNRGSHHVALDSAGTITTTPSTARAPREIGQQRYRLRWWSSG